LKTFTIDEQNIITACASQEQAATTSTSPFECFRSQQELTELAAQWPAQRLVDIWNSLPGVTPVKRFQDRKTAASRIWKSIQGLDEPEKPNAERKAAAKPKSAKPLQKGLPAKGKPREKKVSPKATRQGSKTATVIALLERKNGATLTELRNATGWLAHSVRGFISGTLGKKMGRTVESTKREDGERVYSIKD